MMHTLLLLLLLLQPAPPPDPQLRAYLDAPGQSTVTWRSDRMLCLSYDGVFDSCYGAGRVVITFGHVGPLDGTLRPSLGGVYVVSDPASSAAWRAELRRRALYFPVFRA